MPVTSSDTNYNGADPQDIAFTNLDDDSTSSSTAGSFIITAPDNATTSENGVSSSFQVRLSMVPTSNVAIPVYVSDNTEALISSGSSGNVDNLTLNFSSSNWNINQNINVIGQADDDGHGAGTAISFKVILMPALSDDSNFNGANPQDLEFINLQIN